MPSVSRYSEQRHMAMKPVKVSQLNSYIKRVLSTDPILGNISVIGEISSIKYHGSGHVYFSLKDESARINCFLPADTLSHISYELSDGMEIIAYGYVSVYEMGGRYSLNIRDIEVQGKGDLAASFEKLKRKLAAEGIFDEAHKKAIPFFPKRVAVVTSETGAAVQDILRIIKSRNNYADVLVYPVLVQGPEAAPEISSAIENINRLFPDVDVMIVGRGGGSAEELWAFNEEIVARAIYNSRIPVISAVGHEIDFTIADFAADLRAPTPTAAAALAVPDTLELKSYIEKIKDDMLHALRNHVQYKERLMEAANPDMLRHSLENKIDMSELKVENFYKQLCDLNPMNIAARGYAAITDENGVLKSRAADFKKGDILKAVFIDGSITAEVLDRGGSSDDK